MKKTTKTDAPVVKKSKKADPSVSNQIGPMMPGMLGKSKKAPKSVAKSTKKVAKAKREDDDQEDIVSNNSGS
jgi:hypothetical protein